MNPKNAEELLSKPDVDGGLIGGASLKADQFAVIVGRCYQGLNCNLCRGGMYAATAAPTTLLLRSLQIYV